MSVRARCVGMAGPPETSQSSLPGQVRSSLSAFTGDDLEAIRAGMERVSQAFRLEETDGKAGHPSWSSVQHWSKSLASV